MKKEKNALSPRQCTMSQVDCNEGKTTWIASAPTLFSRSGPQQLLAVCRPQKNAPKKDLAPMKKWYQKLRHILRPKTFVLQKSHPIIREAMESVNYPRRRLYWWIKSNFAWKVLFLVRPGTYWVMCYISNIWFLNTFCR